MRDVAVLGVGCTKVGEHWECSLKDLFVEASLKALADSGVEGVDALYVSNMASGLLQRQEHLGAVMADALGISEIPAVRVEAASASGGVAFHEGVKAVASGMNDLVLVGGVEKMTDILPPEVASTVIMSEDQEYTAYTGITYAGLCALLKRLYMGRFDVKPEEIAMISVVGHENAASNPYAQYPFKTSVERVLSSPMEADPIHLLECAGIGDGAAAVVLGPAEEAEIFSRPLVVVSASTVATDTLSLTEREDILTLRAVRSAAQRAYDIAKLTPRDIDVLEVHDEVSILGVLSLEDLGFAEKGEGAGLVAGGGVSLKGVIPTTTFGGLKARGNPLGATGLYQIAELTWQLRGEAGKNQVEGAGVGLAQNMGGIGSTCAVNILRREDL